MACIALPERAEISAEIVVAAGFLVDRYREQWHVSHCLREQRFLLRLLSGRLIAVWQKHRNPAKMLKHGCLNALFDKSAESRWGHSVVTSWERLVFPLFNYRCMGFR